MLEITVLGIAVAVNVILELRDPKIYNEGLIFSKVIHNSNLFLDVFAFPSQTLLKRVFPQYRMEILVGKYAFICEHLFRGYLLSDASLDSSREH